MTATLTEEQKVILVRNALLVAGQEMGEKGDHWPVINATIHKVMQDWEELKTQRNVDEELEKLLHEQIKVLEEELPNCATEERDAIAADIRELREVCDARFTKLDNKDLFIDEELLPAYVKRAKAILATLEDDDEQA